MDLVTPVVMSATRPSAASRQLQRLAQQFSTIILANAGPEGQGAEIVRCSGAANRGCNVDVLEAKDFIDRFSMAASRATTPFVAMVPEDDEISAPALEGIGKCLNLHSRSALGSGRWLLGRRLATGTFGAEHKSDGLASAELMGPRPQIGDWRFQPELYWGIYRADLVEDLFGRSECARRAFVAHHATLSRVSQWRVFELTVVLLSQARYLTCLSRDFLYQKETRRSLTNRLDRWSGFLELETQVRDNRAVDATNAWMEALTDPRGYPKSMLSRREAQWAQQALNAWAQDCMRDLPVRRRVAPLVRHMSRATQAAFSLRIQD